MNKPSTRPWTFWARTDMAPERYDFKAEARRVSINEACVSEAAVLECNSGTLCRDCRRLAGIMEQALRNAYSAGVRSMSQVEGGNE